MSLGFVVALWNILATVVFPGRMFPIASFNTADVKPAAFARTALAVKGKADFPAIW